MNGDLERLGEQIAEQAAHLDAATHRLLTNLREFDARGGWHVQGASSCAHWLAWRVGWDLVTARERVRVAGRLADFALIDDALRRGEVSYSKVRALVRIATPANEAMVLEYARLTTASQLEKICRKFALVQRHCQERQPRDDEQRRYVRRRDTDDGMVKIEAVLHPEEAEMVWTMLDHAAKHISREPHHAHPARVDSAESRVTTDTGLVPAPLHAAFPSPSGTPAESCGPAGTCAADTGTATATVTATAWEVSACLEDDSAETRWMANAHATTEATVPSSTAIGGSSAHAPSVLHQRADATKRAFNRADALLSITQAYLRGDQPQRAPVEVMITIPASSLRKDAGDTVEVGCMGASCVSAEAARRLSCDAGVIEVVEDEHGVPLSVGRKRRTIAGSIKRALLKRDTACTFPGCDHRTFVEGHHIEHWADGGETTLDNAALLCTHHHRYVHEYGYAIELDADKRPQFRDPSGRLVAAIPARHPSPELGWPRIRAANELLAIDADTIACEWDGSPVDYARVIGQLVVVDGLK